MMDRRVFLAAGALPVVGAGFEISSLEHPRVLRLANQFMKDRPVTVTANRSDLSAGGLHDFFSEGDYWWPDPNNPDGPYLQRDGMTNPANFVAHRQSLMKLSVQVPALAAAWKLTRNRNYALHAASHLRAWFTDEATRMNPNLEYAQAIHGRFTGRGIGVIDTIHLVEVAQAIPTIAQAGALPMAGLSGVRRWFYDYLQWMTTSKKGIEEREAKNNHGTCWLMQAAAFARVTGNREVLAYCADRFKTVIVPAQIDPDGSLPLEMRRTKPYGYCLFNLEALSTASQILNLWDFETSDGRSVKKAIEYMVPFIRDKKLWKLPPDVMYHDNWPMRQESLLFGAKAYGRQDWFELWKGLPADSDVEEVVRNYFIRQPVLWI